VRGSNKRIYDIIDSTVALMTRGLDAIMKPLKIGGKNTKLLFSEDQVGYDKVPTIDYELANKAYVDDLVHNPPAEVFMDKDLTLAGDLTINGNTLTFGNGEIIHNQSDGLFTFVGSDLIVDKTGSSSAAKLALFGDSGFDAAVLLYNAVLVKWSIGNDANDSDKLKFDAGNATVGAATKATLDSSGNFVTAGSITDGSGNVLGSGGASSLNDLSDVSVSGANISLTGANQLTFGAQGVEITAGEDIILNSTDDIFINADGGDITFKDASLELAKVKSTGIKLPDLSGLLFGDDETDKFYGDGTDLLISKDDTDVWMFEDIETKTEIPLKIRESASAVADTAAYGQLWVKSDTPNNLYFTNDAGSDVQITNGSSLASGGGGSTTLKAYMDWYYVSANVASTNTFYAATHHDEFGVSSAINTGISNYTDTEHSDIWRVARYAKRIPYSGTITKVMTHVESTGASADSDIEVGVWIASFTSLNLNQQYPSTQNIAIDNLAKIDFDFDTATRLMFSETTSFNATSLTQGDWMFITLRRTSGTDGSSFNCHTTVTMDLS